MTALVPHQLVDAEMAQWDRGVGCERDKLRAGGAFAHGGGAGYEDVGERAGHAGRSWDVGEGLGEEGGGREGGKEGGKWRQGRVVYVCGVVG